MSREIKFRAWDKKQKKMLYGVSIGTIKVWDENAPIISHEFSYSEDCIFEQYTGLKDKNGIEIYEGDVVKKYEEGDIVPIIGIVEFCKSGARFGVNGGRYLLSQRWNVIGNIHENPELLEN